MSDDTADILMRQLPPTGWGEITTNANLDHAVSRLRTELKHDITTHTQILRIEFQEHLGDLRTEMATEFDKTHVNIAELSTRFERALHEQTKSLFRMVFAANAVFVGLIVAASQLR
jgi:glycine cleavage system regulatory protein